MAYCKSCGAYIPDGQTKCLACGFDESAEPTQNTQSGAAAAAQAAQTQKKASNPKYHQFDSETLQRQLEEQRRRQQENSRKWAETEYAQRKKAREEQEQNFTYTSGAEGEYRSGPRKHNARNANYTETVRSTVNNADRSKVLAGMSYLGPLYMISKLLAPEDIFVAYHSAQGRKLFIASVIGLIISSILNLGGIILVASIALSLLGIKNVSEGKKKPLPIIGNLFK